MVKEKNWNKSTPEKDKRPLEYLLLMMDPIQTNCGKWQIRPQCGQVISEQYIYKHRRPVNIYPRPPLKNWITPYRH